MSPIQAKWCTYGYFDELVQILAGRRELLGRGVFEIPQLVFHAAVELFRVLLPLQVEFHANGRVLKYYGRKFYIRYAQHCDIERY